MPLKRDCHAHSLKMKRNSSPRSEVLQKNKVKEMMILKTEKFENSAPTGIISKFKLNIINNAT